MDHWKTEIDILSPLHRAARTTSCDYANRNEYTFVIRWSHRGQTSLVPGSL